jgi:hypothetical protein
MLIPLILVIYQCLQDKEANSRDTFDAYTISNSTAVWVIGFTGIKECSNITGNLSSGITMEQEA